MNTSSSYFFVSLLFFILTILLSIAEDISSIGAFIIAFIFLVNSRIMREQEELQEHNKRKL